MPPSSQTVFEPHSGEALLSEYRGGSSFFFASPTGTLLTEGEQLVLAGPAESAAQRAAELLASERNPHSLLVGALPFDPSDSMRLVIPSRVTHSAPLSAPERLQASPQRGPGAQRLFEEPPGREYAAAVDEATRRIRQSELRKVVLARSLCLPTQQPLDVAELLRSLTCQASGGYVFAAGLPGTSESAMKAIVGASPELLVSRSGLTVTSNPLAGSAARGRDPESDRQQAQQLLNSEKDRVEHTLVVDAVAERLRSFCDELDVPEAPSVVATPTVWHLSTRITGRLRDPGLSSLHVALALHPTPAVCGTPTALARETLAELEQFDRGFYAGMVGWLNAAGDGEWIVSLRCAQVEPRLVRLFAGAGIVEGSDPQAELEETSTKFRTVLNALGVPLQVDGYD